MIELIKVMLSDLWEARLKLGASQRDALKLKLTSVETKTANLVDRLVDSGNPSVVRAYESQRAKLGEKKHDLTAKPAESGRPRGDLSGTVRTTLAFFSNLLKLWLQAILNTADCCSSSPSQSPFNTAEMRVFEPPQSQSLSGFWRVFVPEIPGWWSLILIAPTGFSRL